MGEHNGPGVPTLGPPDGGHASRPQPATPSVQPSAPPSVAPLPVAPAPAAVSAAVPVEASAESGADPSPRRTEPGRFLRDPAAWAAANGADGDGEGPSAVWGPPSAWLPVAAGTALTVVKLDPAGVEVARYPGTVVDLGVPAPWLAVEARWVNRAVDLDGLVFHTGDRLVEYFSPAHPFNAFAVWSPAGTLRGWYANVTRPTALDASTAPPTLTWHDLYLDVIALPDGTVTVRDEDELAEAALATTAPALHAAIFTACAELVARVARRAFPFRLKGAPEGDAPAV